MSICIYVQVRDQEIPVKRNFVKVVVQVEDCNDHPPAFLRPHYEASVSSRAPAGFEVIRVKALDKDTGSNAEIHYTLYTGEQNKSLLVFLLTEEQSDIRVVSTHFSNHKGCVCGGGGVGGWI